MKSRNATDILHRRYIGDDKARQKSLEEERIKDAESRKEQTMTKKKEMEYDQAMKVILNAILDARTQSQLVTLKSHTRTLFETAENHEHRVSGIKGATERLDSYRKGQALWIQRTKYVLVEEEKE